MLKARDVVIKLVDADPMVFNELRSNLFPSIEDSRNVVVSAEDVILLLRQVEEGEVHVSSKTLKFLRKIVDSIGYDVEFIWMYKV